MNRRDDSLCRSYNELSASPVQSRPIQWYLLICEAERVRARTGYGLAQTWGFIHAEDYERARDSLDALVEQFRAEGRL